MRALIYIYIPNTQTTPTTHSSTFIHISIHPSIHTHLCNAMVFLFYLSSSPFHFSFFFLLPLSFPSLPWTFRCYACLIFFCALPLPCSSQKCPAQIRWRQTSHLILSKVSLLLSLSGQKTQILPLSLFILGNDGNDHDDDVKMRAERRKKERKSQRNNR